MRTLLWTILTTAGLIIAFTSIYEECNRHKCIDSTHITCDGNCECDGMKCPDISAIDRQLKDYQLDIYMDTFRIYDRGRLVGTFITDGKSSMDSIILADNQ